MSRLIGYIFLIYPYDIFFYFSSGKNQHRVNGQYSFHINTELRERKEDYDKLKERLERLEVISLILN